VLGLCVRPQQLDSWKGCDVMTVRARQETGGPGINFALSSQGGYEPGLNVAIIRVHYDANSSATRSVVDLVAELADS
jgi:hypothetical protein